MRNFDELSILSNEMPTDEWRLMGYMEEADIELMNMTRQEVEDNLVQLNRVFALHRAHTTREFAFMIRHYVNVKLDDHIDMYMLDVELQLQVELFLRRFANQQMDVDLFESIMQIFHILDGVTYDCYLGIIH